MQPHRKVVFRLCALAGCAGLVMLFAAMAEESATEAPAGFNTPSFNGAASKSNGLVEPTGDTFALDQEVYERNHDVGTGLGPVYNGTACVTCHENPNSGAASQITELRVGHNAPQGHFVNPTVFINDGQDTITGRSIVNDRAICPQAQEHIPATEDIIALRAALNTLGDGFVEAIPDQTLIAISKRQPGESGGKIQGEAIEVPIFEAPGKTRVGRFGWKDQHGSLLSFIADAYVNEMGVTNRLRPTDVTTVCKTTKDPEDHPDRLGLADIDHFAQFIRGTMVPPRDTTLAETSAAIHGERVFNEIGCSTCHVATMVTAPAGTIVNGGQFTIPDALANKIIHPYGDFLLHDVGTGDGIVQTTGLYETAKELRTAPLWGLRTKSRFMHDLKSLSVESAITRHKNEAADVEQKFSDLSPSDKQDLLDFLNSL
jgi:CxxC motif-containing protein (DUF1111 family)